MNVHNISPSQPIFRSHYLPVPKNVDDTTSRENIEGIGALPLGLYHWGSTTGALPLGLYHWGSTIGALPLGLYHWGSTIGALPLGLYHRGSTIGALPLGLYHYRLSISNNRMCDVQLIHHHKSVLLFNRRLCMAC